MFISDHAIIIIFGGSFAATLIRFPLSSAPNSPSLCGA
jgi:flagellar motor component MotA